MGGVCPWLGSYKAALPPAAWSAPWLCALTSPWYARLALSSCFSQRMSVPTVVPMCVSLMAQAVDIFPHASLPSISFFVSEVSLHTFCFIVGLFGFVHFECSLSILVLLFFWRILSPNIEFRVNRFVLPAPDSVTLLASCEASPVVVWIIIPLRVMSFFFSGYLTFCFAVVWGFDFFSFFFPQQFVPTMYLHVFFVVFMLLGVC